MADNLKETKLQYRWRTLSHASVFRFMGFVKQCSKASGKSMLWIAKDMIHCTKMHGSGYHDYVMYKFYDLTDDIRATYLTRWRNKELINLINDPDYSHLYDNKNEFNEIFAKYVKRDFVDMINASDDEIKEYYSTHKRTFAKMLDLDSGTGAELLNMSDFATADDFCAYVREKGFGVLENVVENHDKLSAVNPYALNTMRLITLIDDEGTPHLIYAAQKFGMNKRIVDVRGMHSPIDLDTGIITQKFHSGNVTTDITYDVHPDTGYVLKDFEVPFFKESRDMILEAAMVVPEIRYVGWDVAVTNEGPVIIEGNNYTSYEYMQLPDQNPDPEKRGILPLICELVPSYKPMLRK